MTSLLDEQSTINATDNCNAFTDILILPAHLTTLRHLTKLGKHHVNGLAAALASYSHRDCVRPLTLLTLHSSVMAAARYAVKSTKLLWPGMVVKFGRLPARGAAASKMRLSMADVCLNHS